MKYFRTHRRGKPRKVYTWFEQWNIDQTKVWNQVFKEMAVPAKLLNQRQRAMHKASQTLIKELNNEL